MAVFWRLILGHFIADFTFQTNYVAVMKRQRVWGMLLHSVLHPLVYIVLAYPYLSWVWLEAGPLRLNGWFCMLLLFILHFLQDEWRVYSVEQLNTSDSTGLFLWDQIVHYAAIFVLFPQTPILEGVQSFWFPERWVMIGILLVAITHATTVLIYFLEKDMWEGAFPGFDEKYLTMGERLVLALCFLLPGWWWLPSTVVCLGAGVYVRKTRFLEYSWFGFLLGAVVACSAGISARLLLL